MSATNITKKTVYVAEDGTEFATHHEAHAHSAKIKRKARLAEWLLNHGIVGDARNVLCDHADEIKSLLNSAKPPRGADNGA